MSDKLKMDWFVNGLLAVIVVLLAGNYAQRIQPAHAADDGGGWATNGIMVGSTSGQAERLILVDTRKMNIMIYHARPNGGLGLSGARSYKYDVEIVDTEGSGKTNKPWTYFDAMAEYEAKK